MVRSILPFVFGTAVTLSGCGPATARDDERSMIPSQEIAESVERCGLDLSKVTFVETDSERYLTFERHPVLNNSEMNCLARVLISAEYGLRTDDDAFDWAYSEAWESENSIYFRNLAREWIATNRPSLVVPRFSGEEGDLPDFVAAVERLCNAPPGSALVTDPARVSFPWLYEPSDEADCVFAVLMISNLNEHGIDVR